ncbi:hypothetical protein [Nostoc sp. PCC 7524]|uniref:hypothetical protein n=1 Tax=Nostoc sp. (strain ATCC 29411 / PCC 7524) TaxID=28072 RepID=UPI0014947925|nr:hypothetical protein [Nostoc sp. PCC 7524]
MQITMMPWTGLKMALLISTPDVCLMLIRVLEKEIFSSGDRMMGFCWLYKLLNQKFTSYFQELCHNWVSISLTKNFISLSQ